MKVMERVQASVSNRTINAATAIVQALSLFILVVILAGCTATTTVADESGLPPHLTAGLQIQQGSFDGNKGLHHVQVEVAYGGEPFMKAEQAQFLIWPEQDKSSAITLSAVETAPGVYSADFLIEQDGLFLVQAVVGSEQRFIMPIRRLAVGAEARQALQELESSQTKAAQPQQQGHHHH